METMLKFTMERGYKVWLHQEGHFDPPWEIEGMTLHGKCAHIWEVTALIREPTSRWGAQSQTTSQGRAGKFPGRANFTRRGHTWNYLRKAKLSFLVQLYFIGFLKINILLKALRVPAPPWQAILPSDRNWSKRPFILGHSIAKPYIHWKVVVLRWHQRRVCEAAGSRSQAVFLGSCEMS